MGVRLARQMMLTGEPIEADQALRAGLVNEVVPHKRLAERVQEIVDGILAAAPAAVDTTLELLAAGEGETLPHALALEAAAKLRRRTDAAEVARRFAERTGRR